jgi:hypothetical protein
MTRNTLLKLTAAATLTGTAGIASAFPITGQYFEDPRCDTIPTQMLTDELGDAAVFPVNEGITFNVTPTSVVVCVPDDGIANDWLVHITNISGATFSDLFFVADGGSSLGNADGKVEDMTGAPGVMTDAFRVDAQGVNANLLWGSMNVDGILQPGEEWEFAVMNFNTGPQSTPPVIISPNKFAGSSQIDPTGGLNSGNASLLAIPIPEPSTLGVFTLFALSMLVRRRKRA